MHGGGTERERFLDAIRTTAVVRVIIWHAFGAAAITYVVSAVPAMFFVTGSLLARSLDRHGARRTILDRLRRMLVPLWAFTAVAFAAMAVADHVRHDAATAVPAWAFVDWLVPVLDPKGSAWEAGWLSSPLWYLRALLWVVLTAPLLVALVRRAPRATFATLIAAVFALDLAARHPAWPLQQTRAPWIAGDVALYSIFVGLGVVHRDGHLERLGRRAWALAAAGAALLAAGWVLTQPVHAGVVNDSHPAHLLVGFAWLAAAFAAAPLIERVARRPAPAAFIGAMNQRSMSVYLWHSTAIIVGYQLLWRVPVRLPYGVFSASLLALTAAGTVMLVTAFGWIEDLAAGRTGAVWPAALARRPRVAGSLGLAGLSVFALVGLAATTTVAPIAAAQVASAAKLPSPSQQPPVPQLAGAAESATMLATSVALTADASAAASAADPLGDALASVVTNWLQLTGVEGAQVAVAKDGQVLWRGAAGTTATGGALGVDDSFDSWSITKTYTASMIYRLVDAGVLALDEPIPHLAALPALDTSRFTLRMLLDHSTGLMPYRDTPGYIADPAAVTDARSAMRVVLAEPLQFDPGTKHAYSSSNYLVLGLLLEQVTGQSYDTLLRTEILEPLGLDATWHAAPTPGNPNFSTGGVMTTVTDLVTWGTAYLASHTGISDTSYAAMTTVDAASSVGAGVIGYCPCLATPTGGTEFAAIGFGGSTTELQFSASDNTVIAINITQSIWDPAERYQQVLDLFGALRTVIDARAVAG